MLLASLFIGLVALFSWLNWDLLERPVMRRLRLGPFRRQRRPLPTHKLLPNSRIAALREILRQK